MPAGLPIGVLQLRFSLPFAAGRRPRLAQMSLLAMAVLAFVPQRDVGRPMVLLVVVRRCSGGDARSATAAAVGRARRQRERRRAYVLDTIGEVGKSELADPTLYPKDGREYSAWLDDVFAKVDLPVADMVAGSMGGWIAMNHAIYAPDKVRRSVQRSSGWPHHLCRSRPCGSATGRRWRPVRTGRTPE